MGDPETWVPLVEAGDDIQHSNLNAQTQSFLFGDLAANYWYSSVVWYDTVSPQSGRVVVVDLNATNPNAITVTVASSQVRRIIFAISGCYTLGYIRPPA